MEKLRALIVDDELFARENLRLLLEEYCPEVEVVGDAGSVKAAKIQIAQQAPDVIFLDIRMPSGAEGFDLLEAIPDKRFQVVFVTAFKDYALRALNANAIHYILKPIDIEELRQAVDKLVATRQMFQQHPNSFDEYRASLDQLASMIKTGKAVKRFTINHAKGFRLVEDEEIIRLEASGNCTKIFFDDGTHYLDTRTLKVYEEMLDERAFHRIHKSHIIKLTRLKEYLSEGGHYAILRDGSRLPIARNRLKEFIAKVKQML